MLNDLIKKLQSPKSSQRRTAAKKLRKIGNHDSCSALMKALEKELQNKRSWETQYHMVMAIGQSKCLSMINDLYRLLASTDLQPMVRVAFGDAIARLEGNSNFLEKAFQERDIDLLSGALRAMAMEQISLPIDFVDEIIDLSLIHI